MTIDEIIARRDKLQEDIEKLIDDFHKETDVHVSELKYQRQRKYLHRYIAGYGCQVEVKIANPF